jgi:hypothetical protein
MGHVYQPSQSGRDSEGYAFWQQYRLKRQVSTGSHGSVQKGRSPSRYLSIEGRRADSGSEAPCGQVVAQCDDSNPDRLKISEAMLDGNIWSWLQNVKTNMFSCFCSQGAGVCEWFSRPISLGLPQL